MVLSNKGITKALIHCADAQAGLRLCCLQTPKDRFPRIKAHIYYGIELFMRLATLPIETKLQKCIRIGITIFKISIWGGISSDIRS